VVAAGLATPAPAPALAQRTVATSVPLAQQRFDLALTEMYAFNGEDAAIYFDAAALSDPHLAIAYWGKALAVGSDLNHPLTEESFDLAHAAIEKAKSLEQYASPGERALIDAAARRYRGHFTDARSDETAYETAMRAYVAAHPNDDDATMLLVEALLENHGMHWNDDGAPADAPSAEMLQLTQGVLARDPSQLMANHLCIHLYDTAPNRTPAIACAQRLDAMQFGEGEEHLAHMPAHLWIEIGDGERALASSERAWALDPTTYAEHDAYVAFDAALVAGDEAAAAMWATRLTALDSVSYQGVTDVRFGDAQDALHLKPPQAHGLLVNGFASLAAGDLPRARADLRLLQRRHLTADAALLGARIDERDGNVAAAIALLQPFAGSERNDAEAIPFFPPNEALAALYYRAGRYAGAQRTFAAILAQRPDDPRALFGMEQALVAQGDPAGAAPFAAAFRSYWVGPPLTMNDF
jgi:tetratricopeptide (TPR) repeat protein